MITKSHPGYQAAMDLLNCAERFREAFPEDGTAVRWLEDTSGRLLVFTRGEYKSAIREAIAHNLQPEQYFEVTKVEREGYEE